MKVEIDMGDIETLVTDVVECLLEMLVVIGDFTYESRDFFYLAEGDTETSLFWLHQKYEVNSKSIQIDHKVYDIEY